MSNLQENVSSSGSRQKGRAAFIVRLVMFKSKEKYNDNKILCFYLQYLVGAIDIANGSSSYKSRFSHGKTLFFLRSYEASNGV